MTKAELVNNVAEATGATKKDVEAVIKQTFAEISGALAKKDSVQIAGFGTFSTVDKAARTGRNPITGANVEIPAKTVPKFKPASALKDAVNG